jgi:hypothetical protein
MQQVEGLTTVKLVEVMALEPTSTEKLKSLFRFSNPPVTGEDVVVFTADVDPTGLEPTTGTVGESD